MHRPNSRMLSLINSDIPIAKESIKRLGTISAAFIQQLHYWMSSPKEDLGKIHENKRWIYNRYEDWTKQIGIASERTLRRHINKLEELGIILSLNLNRKKSDRTKWYTINYDKLFSLFPKKQTPQKSEAPIQLPQAGKLKKVASPSGQNGQIIYRKQITTSNNTLSKAPAPDKKDKSAKQPDIPKKMLDIWIKAVEEGSKHLELTHKRAAFLTKAFTDSFHHSLDEWMAYCQKVASSNFLMGKVKASFKASLDWALKFDIIQRILEGQFGVESNKRGEVEVIREDIEAEIETLEEDEESKQLRRAILKTLSGRTGEYSAWFRDVKINLRGEVFELLVPSSFVRDCISTRYKFTLEEATASFKHPRNIQVISREG